MWGGVKAWPSGYINHVATKKLEKKSEKNVTTKLSLSGRASKNSFFAASLNKNMLHTCPGEQSLKKIQISQWQYT